jgi:hypothetical protein
MDYLIIGKKLEFWQDYCLKLFKIVYINFYLFIFI